MKSASGDPLDVLADDVDGFVAALDTAPGELDAAAMKLATFCTQVMRDGIAAEKHVVFASLAKMQIGTGFATGATVGAWGSNLHFRAGEFNFLREVRERGLDGALGAAQAHFTP